MAEYYLKTSTYCYRISYHQDGANYIIDSAHVSGTGTLPDGMGVRVIDGEVSPTNILVDQIRASTSAATVADYRTAVKAQADTSW